MTVEAVEEEETGVEVSVAIVAVAVMIEVVNEVEAAEAEEEVQEEAATEEERSEKGNTMITTTEREKKEIKCTQPRIHLKEKTLRMTMKTQGLSKKIPTRDSMNMTLIKKKEKVSKAEDMVEATIAEGAVVEAEAAKEEAIMIKSQEQLEKLEGNEHLIF